MLERLGVGELADRRPGGLSGGVAQRVARARALVVEPSLLLLDEPLAAMDVTTRVSLRRTLARHLATFPGPRLLITHDPTEAFLLADEIHVMEGGSVTQAGNADEIRLRPKTPYVADLAGSNLLAGVAEDGVVDVGGHRVHIVDHAISGPVLATVHPRAVALHLHAPEGSPRNVWRSTVVLVERLGERVRVQVGAPLPLTVEITAAALHALGLAEGTAVWLSVKATEITVEPDGPESDGVSPG
jgi:molybdopterin-binding protein